MLDIYNNLLRTGDNLTETTLTPGNVNANSFGMLFSINAASSADLHCGQMAPEVGITDTPAIDPNTSTTYIERPCPPGQFDLQRG